jgi:hypothetical protein
MRIRSRRADEGHATLFFITGMALFLIAVSVLFLRLTDAQDQRTQAQTAADAAALAAVGEIKDRAAENLANGLGPQVSYDPTSSRSAAETYARENDAVLEDIRASDDAFGLSGHTVRVEVRGAHCQRELEEDRSRHWADMVCDGSEDDAETIEGNAAAIAEVDMPRCDFGFGSSATVCGDVTINSVADARSVIDVRLVAEEGQYLYSGMSSTLAAGSLGPVDPGSNRAIAREMLADYGWDTEEQWNCLDNLWHRESGWDHTARNSESGAYGIPQLLPSAHPQDFTAEFRSSPEVQIRWGLDYIQGRSDYADPCQAWALWQSRSPHWY